MDGFDSFGLGGPSRWVVSREVFKVVGISGGEFVCQEERQAERRTEGCGGLRGMQVVEGGVRPTVEGVKCGDAGSWGHDRDRLKVRAGCCISRGAGSAHEAAVQGGLPGAGPCWRGKEEGLMLQILCSTMDTDWQCRLAIHGQDTCQVACVSRKAGTG